MAAVAQAPVVHPRFNSASGFSIRMASLYRGEMLNETTKSSKAEGFAKLDSEAFPQFEKGWVWLVGAGPGAPGLMALLAYHAMQNCDVVVYDALVNPVILNWVRAGAELEYAGKRGGRPSHTQTDISLRLIELAQEGKRVLRLKGGDPFMFGRGGEESQTLAKHGVPFRIVPGISSGIGGLAYAGIPVTHRDTNHAVIFLTGHDATGKMPANVNWPAVATAAPVIVMYMSVKNLGEIATALHAQSLSKQLPTILTQMLSETVPQLTNTEGVFCPLAMTPPLVVFHS